MVIPENKQRTGQVMPMSDDQFFSSLLSRLSENEGGLNENEIGGTVSKFGITQETFDNYNLQRGRPLRDVSTIEEPERVEIFKNEFYLRPKVNTLPRGIQNAVFDFGVHSGYKIQPELFNPIQQLQRVVGTFPDGVLGPKTWKAIPQIPEEDIRNSLADLRIDRVTRQAQSDPEMAQVLDGVIARINRARS